MPPREIIMPCTRWPSIRLAAGGVRLIWAAAILATAPVAAQPPAPSPEDVQYLRQREAEIERLHPDLVISAPVALAVNISTRAQARAFYNAIFQLSDGVPSGWTGNLSGTPGGPASGTAGTTSAAFQAAEQLRINWYRAMAGLPAAIAFDTTEGADDALAALMMSANNALDHYPPMSWVLYSALGATAAGDSNLSIGQDGPDAITGYIMDAGSNNSEAGHRRWLLYPQTQTMASGDVDATGNFLASNATWIMDGNYGGLRPAVRDNYVAWPPPGYVPYQVVFPRWSFAYPGADFTHATVTMTSGGQPVAVNLEPLSNSQSGEAGENTLVWDYNGLDPATVETSAPQPASDLAYNVQINGIGSAPFSSISYQVTLFDPAVAGTGDTPPTLTGPSAPQVGGNNPYAVGGLPAFASGFKYRTVTFGTAGSYGAEGGLQGVIASVSSSYNPVDPGVAASGAASYHLATPDGSTQTLSLPGEYSATNASASLQFASLLGYATATQVAHVQISLNDGVTWSDLYTQAGSGGSGESAFSNHSLSLAPYAGLVFEIRFTYTFAGNSSFYNETSNGVGWNIDNIAFTSASSATPGNSQTVGSGSTFSYSPSAPGAAALQAAGLLFDTYVISWGPVLNVVAAAGGSSPVFTAQPVSQSITTGSTVVFSAVATGAQSYQWYLGPSAVPGATSSQLLIVGATAANAGSYTCVASNSLGSATSLPATLTVLPATNNPGRLGNLSVLTQAGNGSKPLTVGFEVGGAGVVGSQTLLIRGDGPLLAATPFNKTGTLASPVIDLFASGSSTVLAANSGWSSNQAAVVTAEANTYAYPLATGSLDAAMVSTLASGAYSVQLTGNPNGTGSGLALAEVYDDTPAGTYTLATPRLINLSCLAQVNAGAGNNLTAGFVIGGTTSKTVLIRAWGPALSPAPFSITGAMPDPQLQVYNSSSVLLASNAGWGGNAQIVAAGNLVYDYAWNNAGSADSAVLITLPPGNYTAQASSISGSAGTTLVEVFEIP
jgi:hypothetical protein